MPEDREAPNIHELIRRSEELAVAIPKIGEGMKDLDRACDALARVARDLKATADRLIALCDEIDKQFDLPQR